MDQSNHMAAVEEVKPEETKDTAKKENTIANANQQEIKVSPKLLQERGKLIAEINSNTTPRSDHQVAYRYTALNPDNKVVTNTFPAYSKMEVFTFLEGEGYKVFKIETSASIERFYGSGSIIRRKMSTKDLVFWLEQLSTYLKAGIPLTDAMRILSKQMGRTDFLKRVFDTVVYDLTLGENFSTCLENQNTVFPSLLINMVKTAEATGDLEGTLDDMAAYYSNVEKTRKEMKSALTYPILILLFAFGVVAFILLYLVPQFEGIYQSAGANVNKLTAFIIAASKFLKNYIVSIIIGVILFIIVLVVLYKKVKSVRYYMQKFAMKLPVFGNMIIYKEITIFTRTFANLLKNNVFTNEQMRNIEEDLDQNNNFIVGAFELIYITMNVKDLVENINIRLHLSQSEKENQIKTNLDIIMKSFSEEEQNKVRELYEAKNNNLMNILESEMNDIKKVKASILNFLEKN